MTENFALIEEDTFDTLVNAYATLEILRQCNPGFMEDLAFDEEAYELVKAAFRDDYVTVPIDFSAEAIDRLETIFDKEGD